MSREEIIVGLDIGTTSMQAVVATKKKTQEVPQVVGWAEISSRGVRRGAVVDIEETAAAIRARIVAWRKQQNI